MAIMWKVSAWPNEMRRAPTSWLSSSWLSKSLMYARSALNAGTTGFYMSKAACCCSRMILMLVLMELRSNSTSRGTGFPLWSERRQGCADVAARRPAVAANSWSARRTSRRRRASPAETLATCRGDARMFQKRKQPLRTLLGINSA